MVSLMTDEKLLSLSPAALRTWLAIRSCLGQNRPVQPSMETLETLTGYKRQRLSTAITELKTEGLLVVTRTKRNLGKLSYNEYSIPGIPTDTWSPSPGIPADTLSTSPCILEDTSTADSNSNNYLTTVLNNDLTSHRKNSRYKEIPVTNGKWRPRGEDTTGDDEIGGFGLLENEQPAAAKVKLSTDRRDPKTRGRRPEAEWTPIDVAMEFSFQLARKYPLIPGLISTKQLSGALAANRKKFGISAPIEMEIMRLFLGDERKHFDWNVNENYKLLYKRFLRMFTTDMDRALNNLGMPSRRELVQIDAEVADEPTEEYVYASDGRQFDNSIPGRKSLERYEEKLRG